MAQSKHQLNTAPIKSRLGPASIPVILMDTTKALSLLYIRKFAVFVLFLRLIKSYHLTFNNRLGLRVNNNLYIL